MKKAPILFNLLLAACLTLVSCSEEIPELPSKKPELVVRASQTEIETETRVTFEVLADGTPIEDALLYLDDNALTNYTYIFEEPGEYSIVAKKEFHTDSEPLRIVVTQVPSEEPEPKEVDIYVLGSLGRSNYRPMYWKNSEAIIYEHEALGALIYHDMTVSQGNVYITGERLYSGSRASTIQWKNGVFEEFTDDRGLANGWDITVVEGDVYISGIIKESPWEISIVYYKNGVKHTVATGEVGMTGLPHIAVSNGDVYIAALLNNEITLWKNEEKLPPVEEPTGQITSLVVDQEDIYIAGYDWSNPGTRAQYWKNGQKFILGEQNSEALDLYVDQGDVYVAGWERIPKTSGTGTQIGARYWKNGVAVDLAKETNRSDAYGIYVYNNTVYVAGIIYGSTNKAIVWIDGEANVLSGSENGRAFDIMVVPKT